MEAQAAQTQVRPADLRALADQHYTQDAPAMARLARRVTPPPVGFFEHDAVGRVVISTIDDSRRVVEGLRAYELLVRCATELGMLTTYTPERTQLQYDLNAVLEESERVTPRVA